MKQIRTKDAVGHIICHDITRIIKDKEKGVVFKKGHVVTAADIPVLLSVGKENLYVWERSEGMLHEDEAAKILAAACQNKNMSLSEPSEGKIEIFATAAGLFVVDVARLNKINSIDNMMIATRHTLQYVKSGDKLAGTRIIPLVIEQEKMALISQIADSQNPILSLLPIKRKNIGIVTTGSEVYKNRITDTFTPVIVDKIKAFGAKMTQHTVVGDDKEQIQTAILEMKERGAKLIICTGGMSVDPDDLTPAAIRDCGVNIVTYGAPVLPGAMFLLGYFSDGVPVLGLPGCVMYAKATIFDMILPRVLADMNVTKQDIVKLGNGGLCLGCSVCHYPNCGYGKGI
jgi:molybdenum cofactor synthesis domain-containing protein